MPSERFKITVMSGADDGSMFEFFQTPINIGRNSDNEVCLTHDRRVSRHHARITKEGDVYYIQDVGLEGRGSLNGTFVGENRVYDRMPILTGSMILLGTVLIKFEC